MTIACYLEMGITAGTVGIELAAFGGMPISSNGKQLR